MIEIRDYKHNDLSKELNLQLFLCGSATLDSSWKGQVVCSAVSRLYFVKKGSFFLIMDGQRKDLREGGWYIIPAGASYEFGSEAETEQLFFHFNLSCADQTDIFGRRSELLTLSEHSAESEELENLMDEDSDLALLQMKNTLIRLLLKFIEQYKVDTDNSGFSPCVIKAMGYIGENLSEALTIKNISEAIFVSESTLTKHFKRELNTTVNRYVDDLILTRAAQMITEGTLSLSAISNLFGFCDQFYFSRKFKAKFGVTPSEYKRMRDI